MTRPARKTYPLSATANTALDRILLDEQIQASGNPTLVANFQYLTYESLTQTIVIYTTTPITGGEETTLDAVVGAHDGTNPPTDTELQPFDNSGTDIAADNVQDALVELDTEKQALDEKGQPGGYAALDGSGRLLASQLPTTVQEFKGLWNANTNTPTLASGVGTQGDTYVVSVAGSTNLDGETDWQIGDQALFNGTAWQKLDNTADPNTVVSVFGRPGPTISQVAGDYNAEQVTNNAVGVAGANVKEALEDHEGRIDTLESGPASDELVKASPADTTPGTLNEKIAVVGSIVKTLLNPGANEQLQFSLLSAVQNMPAVLKRSTADFTWSASGSFEALEFQTTSFETNNSVLRSESNTQIEVLENNTLCLIGMLGTNDASDATTLRARINGATTVEGYEGRTDLGEGGENQVMYLMPAVLQAGDLVSIEGSVPTLASSPDIEMGAVFFVIALTAIRGADGADGADGPPGPPGSGSTVNVSNAGAAVPNGPFSLLNLLAGLAGADAGSGQVNIGLNLQAVAFNAYNAAASTFVGGPVNGILDTERFASDPAFYALSGNVCTVQQAGWYLIAWSGSVEAIGSNNRTQGISFLEIQSGLVPGSVRQLYARQTNYGASGTDVTLEQLSASDVVRIRHQRTNGSASLAQQINGNRLLIIKVG